MFVDLFGVDMGEWSQIARSRTVLKAALVDGPGMASVSLSPMQSNTPEQQSSAMLSNSPLNIPKSRNPIT